MELDLKIETDIDLKALIQKSDTGFSTKVISKILLNEEEDEHIDRDGVG